MNSDYDLYRLFLSGDISAYDQLLLRYGDRLIFYLYGYLHNWHDSEDLMIESFARIMAKKPLLKTETFRLRTCLLPEIRFPGRDLGLP